MKTNNVLLIDDNEIDNYITKHILVVNEFAEKVVVKTSAIDALSYLQDVSDQPEHIPDYIFLDISMPVMDGFGFLEEYNTLPLAIKDKCKILMLTSSNDPEDIEKAGQYAHVKRFLQKPLDRKLLKGL